MDSDEFMKNDESAYVDTNDEVILLRRYLISLSAVLFVLENISVFMLVVSSDFVWYTLSMCELCLSF